MSSKNSINETYKQVPTILVCIDATNSSGVILRYACYKAKKLGFAVQIVSIIENSYKNLLFAAKAIAKEKRNDLEKKINKMIEEAHKETGVMASISVREGNIVDEIISEIKQTPDCVMLIFGKSRNSLSDNTVLPIISKQIGVKVKIPVVIVPENITQEYLQKLI